MMDPTTLVDGSIFDSSRPAIRDDLVTRWYDNEMVVWSPLAPVPVHLDPVAALVSQLLDGDVSIAELIVDVHEALGVPQGIARNQLRRAVSLLDSAGALTSSVRAATPESEIDIFFAPPNP